MDVAAALLNSTPVPKMEHVKTENALFFFFFLSLYDFFGWECIRYSPNQ